MWVGMYYFYPLLNACFSITLSAFAERKTYAK
jgi:hypothetical protein